MKAEKSNVLLYYVGSSQILQQVTASRREHMEGKHLPPTACGYIGFGAEAELGILLPSVTFPVDKKNVSSFSRLNYFAKTFPLRRQRKVSKVYSSRPELVRRRLRTFFLTLWLYRLCRGWQYIIIIT